MSINLNDKISEQDARASAASWGRKLIDKGYPRIGRLFVAIGERDFDAIGDAVLNLFASEAAARTERDSFEHRYGVSLDSLLYQTAIDTADRSVSPSLGDAK